MLAFSSYVIILGQPFTFQSVALKCEWGCVRARRVNSHEAGHFIGGPTDVRICGSSLLGLFSQRNPPFSWLDMCEAVFWNLGEKGIFWIREGGLWERSLIVARQNFTQSRCFK